MCKKLIYFVCVVLVLGLVGSASAALPAGWLNQDIGDVGAAGSASESAGTWTVTGSGNDMWDKADEFHLVYTTLRGDGEISARVVSIPDQHEWQKAGVTIRESLDPRSPHVSHIMRETDRGNSAQWRPGYSSNSQSDNKNNPDTPQWVRVVREGDIFRTYLSSDGSTWTLHNNRVKYVPMQAEVLIGLCVTSHKDGELSTCTLDDVKLIVHDPDAAYDPNSKNGARGVDVEADLTWAAGDSATAHEVWFGTDPGAMTKVADKALGDETYDPGTLAYATTYYWQIVEVGGAAGPVWRLTTIPDPAINADSNLVAYYNFEAGYDDSSGYGNHGTPLGDPFVDAGLGGYGSAVYLDGDDCIAIGEGLDDMFDFEGTEFTIAAWVHIDAWSSGWGHHIVGKRGEDNISWTVRRRNDNRLCFTTRRIDNDDFSTSASPPPLGEWLHVACVRDNSNMDNQRKRIYLNGSQDNNGGIKEGASMPSSDHMTYIGARSRGDNAGPENHFTGMIDEVRLYSRALDVTEIEGLALRFEAKDPVPADGDTVKATGLSGDGVCMELDYTPGPTAVSHEGFFSDDYDAVATRDPAVSLGQPPWPTTSETAYYLGYDMDPLPPFARVPLERNKVYYWAVDEFDGTVTIPGPVWSFTVKVVEAWDPDPADGARFLSADAGVALSWTLGDVVLGDDDALSYDVYYGTVKADVETGETPNINVEDPTHTTDPLPKDTVCYWRVDTVVTHEIFPPPYEETIIKGNVWQFETLEEITISDPNLVGWWKLNGNVIDWSGHGYDGVASGDPQYVPGPVVDEAMDFDSEDDFIDLNDKMLEGTLTVALWLQWDGHTGSYNSIMHNNAWNSGSLHLHLRDDGDMNPEIRSVGNLRANTPLTVGQWYHFATVFDMDAMVARLYLDGAQDHQITLTGSGTPYIGPMNIGAYQESSRYFDGRMSDWRLYDRALSQAEIAHIMDVRKAWNPSPADGQRDAPLSSNLTWNAGTDPDTGSEYTKHDVYFSTSFEDVNSQSIAPVRVTDATECTPSLALEYYGRYYWRVNEVGDGGEVIAGNVWTFKAIYDDALIVDPNLVGWWKLDGDPTDSSGYGNDGTENGNPGYVTGYDGQAIELDGDDYVNVDGYKGILGTHPFSIAAWVKTTAGGARTIASWGTNTNGQKVDFRLDNGRVRIEHGNGNRVTNSTVNDGEWHHVAVVVIENASISYPDVTHYIDGQDDTNPGTDADKFGTVADIDVSIGRRCLNNDRFFQGLIDDVRIYDYALSHEEIENVMRINLAWAWSPDPANGETGVDKEPTLSWKPGDFAPPTDGHYVYFGADDPANLALVPDQPQSPNNYSPGALDLGTTYYWAVDEANAAAPGEVDAGRIWSFTITDHLVVDDMESYENQDPNWIFNTWKDGIGDVNCVGGNGTGSGLSSGSIYLSEFQSMKYQYDNDGMVSVPYPSGPLDEPRAYYSVAKVEVADLASGIGSDWTVAGAEALVLHFYGMTTNSIESMWVELTDGSGGKATVTYGHYADEDPCDIDKASWHQWNIDLDDFTDVTLTDVNSIAIGIGDPGATSPGGTGEIYFDDIRLYAPRCILSRRDADFALVDYAPEGDPGGDCVIDYKELDVMSGDWLEYDYNVEPEEPNADGLVAWYELENDANDSSPNELDGTENGTPFYAAGPVGQAMSFDGFDDYVDCGTNSAFDLTDSVSVTCWIKVTAFDKSWQAIVTKGDNSWRIHRWSGGNGINWAHSGLSPLSMGGGTNVNDGAWHHIAGTYDGTNRVLYVDGHVDGSDTPTGTISLSTHPVRIGENAQATGRFWSGMIDDVQIYNYGLSQNEIISVRGLGTLYVPVTSPANISDDEPVTEKKVNFLDYAELMNVWLDEDMFP